MAVPVIVDGLYVNVVLDDVPAVILNVRLAVPTLLIIELSVYASIVTVALLVTVGFPEIIPVVLFNVKPAGNILFSLKKAAEGGAPVGFDVNDVPVVPVLFV